jgi:hypothetical protein
MNTRDQAREMCLFVDLPVKSMCIFVCLPVTLWLLSLVCLQTERSGWDTYRSGASGDQDKLGSLQLQWEGEALTSPSNCLCGLSRPGERQAL